MRYLILAFFALMGIACTAVEEIPCEKGFGLLHKDGREFTCPFTLQERGANNTWIDLEGGPTILDSTVDDYYPLKLRFSGYIYKVKMSGLKEYFTEEQYTVSLSALDKNRKPCGESREFTFYKVAESVDSVEYKGRTFIDSIGPIGFLFFGLKEMPSYDWYHVLNVSCGGKKSFILMGEIKE
jgi:hypothetical protein